MKERLSSSLSSLPPERPFFEENRHTIDEILEQVHRDFPERAADKVLGDSDTQPSPEAMNWMWTHFMGRQHGVNEGLDGKVPIANDDPRYRALADKLHYNGHGFTEARSGDLDIHHTNGLVLGGGPGSMIERLDSIFDGDPRESNIDASTILAGQRLRWRNLLGERSISDIYNAVGNHTGADMEKLRELSPWIRQEEAKTSKEGNDWSGPYATELELGRLCVEAYFRNLIDWKNYDPEITKDPTAVDQTYTFRDEDRMVPARTDALITYHLTNGTKAHVLNGGAVARPKGVPRPNSDSQARELVTLGVVGKRPETLIVGTSPPHIRAGVDIFIRLLQQRVDITKAAIATHPWHKDRHLISALGEIPATHKADMRLRAVLAGENPDAPHLANL